MAGPKGKRTIGHDPDVEVSNAEAVRRIVGSKPFLVDLKPASDVIPELDTNTLLHAGPLLAGWHAVGGALRASVLGALVHLGRARTLAEAEELAGTGELRLRGRIEGVAGQPANLSLIDSWFTEGFNSSNLYDARAPPKE